MHHTLYFYPIVPNYWFSEPCSPLVSRFRMDLLPRHALRRSLPPSDATVIFLPLPLRQRRTAHSDRALFAFISGAGCPPFILACQILFAFPSSATLFETYRPPRARQLTHMPPLR